MATKMPLRHFCVLSNFMCLILSSMAVPIDQPFANLPYSDDYDDTEVIEIDTNAIDADAAKSQSDGDVIDLSFYGSALFGTPDSEGTADRVANYTPEDSEVNPEELGSYLEGDILIPRGKVLTKNGLTTQSSRWLNGRVPFEISGQFSSRDLATIEHAMEEYHRHTCIRFVPRSTESDYIRIVSGNSGCWSAVGKIGGMQEVNLQTSGCLSKPGTAIHELMHALGFLHEQNREERDSFVSIMYNNIQAHAVSNFEKASRTHAFGVPYDYGSVMHYSANAFSKNGRPTIVALHNEGNSKMGQREGFSPMDIEKLNKMYNCAPPQLGPAPLPYPAPGPGVPGQPGVPPIGGNNIISSFLGGLISGLGLGDDANNNTTPATA